ncbi:MAG: hypothetical protein MdMp014T_0180 [Treponematales bacterium]
MVKVSSPLTAAEVSLILGINEATVKRLARERQIPCVYMGRRPRFTVERLVEHFKRLEGEGAA